MDSECQKVLVGVLKGIATVTAGYFSGTCVYMTFSEYPALSRLSEKERLQAFHQIYKGAAKVQPTWLTTSTLCCVGSYLATPKVGRDCWWLGCGLVFSTILPYTIICMFPINYSLIELDKSMEKDDDWVNSTFSKWSKLHAVRTVVSSGVFFAMVYGLWKNL